jgi:thioredoxin reductase
VVVVGGGAAGLAAALVLGRARRSVLVIDAGEPRNAPAAHVHGFLTRDGTSPQELLALGRSEVGRYGVAVVDDRVVAAEHHPSGGFLVRTARGAAVRARCLLLASGLVDELPDVRGVAERWGRDVLHCPYCHGWEVQDQRVAILGTSAMAVHQALLWRQWTSTVVLVVHQPFEVDAEGAALLGALGVEVVKGPAEALEVDPGADRTTALLLAGGGRVPCDAVVVAPRPSARAAVLAQLGVEVAPFAVGDLVLGTHVPVDAMCATSVAGVWAAGNVVNPMEQVIGSAAAGVRAGAAINAELVLADARSAAGLVVA